MSEFTEAVQFLTSQSNPWALSLAGAGIAFYLWKAIREISNQGHSVREKELALLLAYVDNDVSKKHRFSVEQAFSQYYKKNLSYTEIAYLLSLDSPSASIQDYAWASSYVMFDSKLRKPALRRPIRIELRKRILSALMFAAYSLTAFAWFGTVVLVIAKAPPQTVAMSALASVPFGILFWLLLVEHRSVLATDRITQTHNHSVKGTSCGKPQDAPYVER